MSKINKEVFNVSANLFKGAEAIGGNLVINSTELSFEPHKMNIQKEIVSLKMRDIKKVEKRNTLLMIPNGMKVIVKSGEEYNFVVNNRIKIIDYLQTQI